MLFFDLRYHAVFAFFLFAFLAPFSLLDVDAASIKKSPLTSNVLEVVNLSPPSSESSLSTEEAFTTDTLSEKKSVSKAKNTKYSQSLRILQGADELSNNLASWNEQSLSYSLRTPDQKNTFRLGMTRNERFNNTDLSYQVGYSRKVTEKLNTGLDLSFGPGNVVVPVFVAAPTVSYKLPWNFSTQQTYRVARYSQQTTQAGIHTLQYNVKPLKLAVGYTLRHTHIQNVNTVPMTHTAYLTKSYRNNSFVTLSANTGRGAELIVTPSNSRVLEYDRNGIGLNGTHFLTKKSPWGIAWGLNYTHYAGLFDSFGYRVGIQRNF